MKKVTTIILAGGQGSRLYPLTKRRSKPAVPIGGKFRLIDIPISNCLHAEMRCIWIVTQFASASLHRHISATYQMGPFEKGFISILAASQTIDNRSWYQGTADAVRKNLSSFKKSHDNILILSGDHLYRMDYQKYLDFHLKNDTDITVSAIPVPRERVSQLGILKIDRESNILDFVEKPQDPTIIDQYCNDLSHLGVGQNYHSAHLASMGIYIFKKEILFELLEHNEYEDFGKHIIPEAVHKYKTMAYCFNGYWEDIGTIKSFFDAHISLTRYIPDFNFYDEDKPIYTHPRFLPAAKINGAQIKSSIIAEGSIIDRSDIRDCVVGIRSIIRSNCNLERVVMMGADFYQSPESENEMPRVGIGENTVIKNAIIDKNVRIGNNVRLVNEKGVENDEQEEFSIQDGIIVVHKYANIPDNFAL